MTKIIKTRKKATKEENLKRRKRKRTEKKKEDLTPEKNYMVISTIVLCRYFAEQ